MPPASARPGRALAALDPDERFQAPGRERELFADYLTNYYTRFEPDVLLVCEISAEVRGYLMGCRRPLLKQAYQFFANIAVALKALWRCYARPYRSSSRAFLRWVLLNSWREVPVAPRNTPHFHINVLPDARSVRNTRALIQSFLDLLRAHGHGSVYGQTVVKDLRSAALDGRRQRL